MTTLTLGASALEVGRLGYGCWRFDRSTTSEVEARIEAAVDEGMTLIDTADAYGISSGEFGRAESLLGSVIARRPDLRAQIVIATKGGIRPGVPYDSSKRYVVDACEASLRRLGADVIDLYQVHRLDLLAHPHEVADALSALRAAGKVREVGVSNYSASQARALLNYLDCPLVTMQPQLSLLALDAMDNGVLDLCMERGITPLAWSPLAGGALITGSEHTGDVTQQLDRLSAEHSANRAAIGLAFLMAHPAGVSRWSVRRIPRGSVPVRRRCGSGCHERTGTRSSDPPDARFPESRGPGGPQRARRLRLGSDLRLTAWMAPVRACLAGEDLDWLGGHCCCVALDLPTVASLTEGRPAPPAYLDAVWRALSVSDALSTAKPPALLVSAAAPIASGLSTSTSLIIALLRACAELLGGPASTPAELARAAYEIEFEFDCGGGMDQTTIVNGGVLLMAGARDGLPSVVEQARWPMCAGLVVISSRQPKSTHDHIRRVREQIAAGDRNLLSYMREAGKAADNAWSGVVKADLRTLSASVNDAHEAMRDLQAMSTPLLEELRDIALDVGFPGVKLSGAGGGGALLAIADAGAVSALIADLHRAYVQRHPLTEVMHVAPMRPGWYPTALTRSRHPL